MARLDQRFVKQGSFTTTRSTACTAQESRRIISPQGFEVARPTGNSGEHVHSSGVFARTGRLEKIPTRMPRSTPISASLRPEEGRAPHPAEPSSRVAGADWPLAGPTLRPCLVEASRRSNPRLNSGISAIRERGQIEVHGGLAPTFRKPR